MKFIDEINIKNKRLLCRFDYNVPMDENQSIVDDRRIRASLPTINYALDEGAKVIIMSHLGRPKGKVVPSLSLAPVAKRLSRLLGKEVQLISDCVGDKVEKAIEKMTPGCVIMLENLRFYKGETQNEEAFARKLGNLADIYIDDAFGNAHRSHASNVGITKFVKECAMGFLMKRELNYFKGALENPVRPFVAIIGGSKVSDKLEALGNLLGKVDKMVIGGGMAFTFLKAQGYEIGKSIFEENLVDGARRNIERARESGVKLYLPVDCVIAEAIDPKAVTKIVPIQEIDPNWMGLDIGPATIALFREVLNDAKTVVWNGPMGVFEIDAFSRGTYAMVHAIAASHALTIVGGGDTDVAVHRTGESDSITYISTGGGASLELLEGKTLPAIRALEECEEQRV
ncbi:MAG: phosphoglycerate kinase [Syntrophales bacterium]|jgi:phosphoglycerate kinase|nr:phosphoglycerate kinase [Syntrophales bacterium]MDY0043533.1 phosphoglycerate kinase [Syntrophales bacterium]